MSNNMRFYNLQKVKNIFDLEFYSYINTDVDCQNQNGWLHWISHGRFESRSINPLIDFTLLDEVLPMVSPEYRICEYLITPLFWQNSISPFLPVWLEKEILSNNLDCSPIEFIILDLNKYKSQIISYIDQRYQLENMSKFSKKYRTLCYIKDKL